MANNFERGQKIVNRALSVIHNRSALLKRVSREYQGEFGARGGRPGDTIYVRKPSQFTIRDGPVVNLQDINQSKFPITVQPEFGVDVQVSEFDLDNSFDDVLENVVAPAAKRIATELDMRLVQAAYQATYNAVGTPGTPPASTVDAQDLILSAGTMLDVNGADVDERVMVVNPKAEQNLLKYLNLGFNHQGKIGEQYVRGTMQGGPNALGFEWFKSPNMRTHTNGVRGGTPLVNGANQGTINNGLTDNPSAQTTTLITDGWTAAVATRVNKGDVFTIVGVFAVNPDNKTVSADLQQFTATAAAASDGSGNLTLTVSPAIIAGGAFQNVSARPADNAALTFLGATSGVYPVSLAFVPEAYTLATVEMTLPKGMDYAAQKSQDGISIRYLRGFDIVNDRYISRLDIMAAYGTPRPEWGVRVYAG